MSDAIKATMQTRGWEEIEAMLNDEIVTNKTDIVTDKTDYQTIAIQTIARKESGKIVKKVLDKLSAIKNSKPINKQSYK
jgi:UDP-N-acetylglucosamine:LPS N-acetylglucosamine transferase